MSSASDTPKPDEPAPVAPDEQSSWGEPLEETKRGNGEPEKVGSRPMIELVGEIPCPTVGCKGKGQRLKLLGRTVIDNVCDDCAEKAQRERDAEERAERVERLMNRSGATPLMRGWTLESYPQDRHGKAALTEALRWRSLYLDGNPQEQRPNLLLFGSVGSGKTGLAWAVLRSLIEHFQIEGSFLIFPDLLARMREAFDRHVPFDAFTNVGRVPVLVVDDVGAERPTEWAVSQLLTLVDRRYQRNLPTIYTTNYEPHTLAERIGHNDQILGDRIVSRMVASAVQVRLNAGDRRLVKV